jgi:hypothetical protein
VVSGSGGYAATRPIGAVTAPATDGEFTLTAAPTVAFGYLTVTADIASKTLTISYHPSDPNVARDAVVLDLGSGKLGWVGAK